mgnify:CR=1 FL=1
MSDLTAKQEAFCQAIADGKNQADAYRHAYDAGKMKAETIQQTASRLMTDRKVRARVTSLRKDLAEKSLWTREESVLVLREVLEDGDARHSDKIASVKVLNDMQGFNAPVKSEVLVTFPRTINVIAGRA